MNVPLRLAQEEGICAIGYLDDLIVWSKERDACERQIGRLKEILESHGFLINQKESQLIPTQEIVWLGVLWNSR